MRTEQEVQAQLDRAAKIVAGGTDYEREAAEMVVRSLEWILGNTQQTPVPGPDELRSFP